MKERNYGIDFLRLISMFMIVILHVLGKGGILENVEVYSSNYWLAWFLEISAYCAVNCFALISGYVMHKSNLKISKLLELWLQIIFYTITITLIMFIIIPETRSIRNIINAIFPIIRRKYWYLSAYFGMCIFIPIMNLGINKLEKRTLRNILLASFFMMSIMPTVLKSDPYMLYGGYSTAWLCILYLVGGYIEKYDILKRINKSSAISIYLISILFTLLSKISIVYVVKFILKYDMNDGIFISYTSPTIILAGISLFVFCAKLDFKEKTKKMIKLLSPAALGVYIIHEHQLIVTYLINGFAIKFINYNCLIMIIKVIISAIIIYTTCIIIELLRIKLFKVFKVRQMCSKIEELLIKNENN